MDIALISNLPIDLHHLVLDELDSDHVPVISTLYEQTKSNHKIQKLINAPIIWEAFRENLDKNLNNHKRYQNIDDITKSIERITETTKTSITHAQIKPKKHIKVKHSDDSLPLYVQNLIKDKHKARKIWQRTRSERVKRKLNQLTRRVKWELDTLRFNSYRAYLGKVNPNDSSLWLVTRRILKQRFPIPPLKNGIAKYDTNAEKSEAFADYFESLLHHKS